MIFCRIRLYFPQGQFLSKISKKTPTSKVGDELRPAVLTKPEKYDIEFLRE